MQRQTTFLTNMQTNRQGFLDRFAASAGLARAVRVDFPDSFASVFSFVLECLQKVPPTRIGILRRDKTLCYNIFMKKQLPCNSCLKLLDQPKTSKRLYCDDCRKERELVSRRIANKKHRESNKAEYSRKRKEYYRLNETTPEQRALRSEKNKALKIALKQQIFEHYGQQCVCCGESHTEFL